nr:MAG TPA: hypothetical protein [Caudoviricetes sp.]
MFFFSHIYHPFHVKMKKVVQSRPTPAPVKLRLGLRF